MGALTGKTAIITGSTQGIGRAIAERLARDGAKVVVNYRPGSSEKAETVVAAINGNGGRAIALEADVTKLDSIKEFFRQAVEQTGKPDILVNNAGAGILKPLAETTEADFDSMFGLNAKGTLFCMQQAAAHLNDGGRIVNISSSTTMFPFEGAYVYAGSKAAVKMFTEVGALELGKRGITVNTVIPGMTETAMTEGLPDEVKKQAAATSPFNRLGKPEDIADTVAFLASDDARWITGAAHSRQRRR
jgi:3-oxoacyl-[acyl-carrier protein] reductase